MRSDVESIREVRVVREIEHTFARGCARPGFRLVHYSLQGNHAHLIVEAVDRDALGCGMKAIGSRLARAVNRITGHRGPVLAERYHLRLLPTPKEVRNALRYVLLNAQKHVKKVGKGVTRAVRFDHASSARWFDGWRRGLSLTRATEGLGPLDPRPVARARTWLLSVGWRRHGLIDPAEAPG
jgi:hypothetical protein